MSQPIIFTRTLSTAAAATNIAASQSPGAGAIALNGSAVSGGVASLGAQRRVIVTSGGNDLGITFTVTGTNDSGAPITDTFAGASGGAAQSNLDFATVTKVTHTGSIASTVTVGTNGVGSSLWQILNRNVTPFSLGLDVELVSGSANFTIEYCMDDPNVLITGVSFPLPIADPTIAAKSATTFGSSSVPVFAFRLTTNSGTGALRCRAIQAGLASP